MSRRSLSRPYLSRRLNPAESENPLAVRRNEAALKSITGRQPSLAKPGVKMRPRNNSK